MPLNRVVLVISKGGLALALTLTLAALSCTTASRSDPRDVPLELADQTFVTKGRSIDASVSGGESHIHHVRLGEDQSASVEIEHESMELLIRVMDADGRVELEQRTRPGDRQTVIELAPGRNAVLDLHIEPVFPTAVTGKYRVELRTLRRATEKQRLMHDARRHSAMSSMSYKAGDYAEALEHAQRALEITESVLPADHPEVGVRASELGLVRNARGEHAKADVLFERAIAIGAKQPRANLALAEATNQMAKNAGELGRFGEAERLAEEALRIRREALGDEHFLVAVSLQTLADIHVATREVAKAEELSERALEIAAKAYPPDTLDYQEFATRAARAHTLRGNYARAGELLDNAWKVRQKLAGSEGLPAADSLTELAFLHITRQENVKAEELTLQSLQLKEKILGTEHPQIASLLSNLGLLAQRKRDYPSATAYLERAMAIIEATFGESHFSMVPALNNLGLVAWREGDYPRAETHFRRALELSVATNGPDSPQTAIPLSNLGIIAKETGDYTRAEEYYKRSLAIREKTLGASHPELVATIESLGILYRDRGDYDRSEPFFLRALEISTTTLGPEHRNVARHLKNLAHLYSARGDRSGAHRASKRLAEIEERSLPLNLAIGSERQKLAYFEPYMYHLEKLISFHVASRGVEPEARDLAATTLLQRKGRVLDAMIDSNAALRARSGPEDRARFDELNAVTSKLATLVLNGPRGGSLETHQSEVELLTRHRETIEDELNRITAGQFERTSAVALDAVKAAIPADAALIEFAIYRPYDPKTAIESDESYGEQRYIAYVISRNAEVEWRELGPTKVIDDAVDVFRRALRNPDSGGIRASARLLDEKVMRPIRALTGDRARLLIAPDGRLALIPFEALIDEDGRYLIESYSISYLGSGRDLLRMQVKRPSASQPLIVADPFFGEPPVAQLAADRPALSERVRAVRGITTGEDLTNVYFAPLTGTAHEARSIKSLFPEAEVLTRSEASEALIRSAHSPSILHIATHGFFLEDPDDQTATDDPAAQNTRALQATARIENPLLRSGLALAGANLASTGEGDGILTALEAAGLNLWGTKLVTLSACDTGVGEVRNGEGVYGLRRALFIAGTETLVMSLWPVSDYVTRQMMTSYYTGLRRGLGRGEALRQAQLTMLRRTDRRHPFYWASFIQSGEWADLEGRR